MFNILYHYIIFTRNKIVEMDAGFLYDGVGKFNSPLLACLVISWMINYLLLTASNDLMKYVCKLTYNYNLIVKNLKLYKVNFILSHKTLSLRHFYFYAHS